MDSLREWSELLRSWWTKLEDKGSHGSQVCMTRVTPQSGSIAAHNTAHTQEERCTPTAKHLRSPRNVPNPTETHEEAREQARKELH